MKKIVILLVSIVALVANIFASEYPKSRVEKEMDEMGSIAGGEGLVFRPNLVKNSATKAKIGNVNKYLFQASIEVLKPFPIAVADSGSGLVVTDWYSPKGQAGTQFKINVHIQDDVISANAIEVTAHERPKVDGKWSEDVKISGIASVIEDKILRKARDLYLKSSEK